MLPEHGACYPRHRQNSRQVCLHQNMREVRTSMMTKISGMLEGEHVCVTTGGWTSCANDTYMSLTISLITSAWKLVTLSVECSKSAGTTTGEALAEGVKAPWAKHGLEGKVIVIITDCEPSMVKMGRLLEGSNVCVHVGCTNHRLESTTYIVFKGPGIAKAIALPRGLVGCYSTSSQMTDRLAQFVRIYISSEKKRVIQDVSTRWWSSCSMIGRLLEPRWAIDKYEEEDKLSPMLTLVDWAILELIHPISEPFMHMQTLLEGRQYVTGSLVVPFIVDLRMNLDCAIDELMDLPASVDATTTAARVAVMPCAPALQKDFVNRWGDGSGILTYTEGNRKQPRDFKPLQVLATALDPRTKIFYGVEDEEKPEAWKFLQDMAVDIALKSRQERNSAGSSSQQPAADALAGAGRGAEQSASPRKRPRRGSFMEVA